MFAVAGLGCGKKSEETPKTDTTKPTTDTTGTGGTAGGTGGGATTNTTGTGGGAAQGGGVGIIHGKIMFDGKAPEMKELPRFTDKGEPKDKACATHEKASYVMVDPAGGVADTVVRLPPGSAPKANAPAAPVVIDQKNCLYTPHVISAIAGSKVAFHNSDPTMHNIHPFLPSGEWFNQAQQKGDPDIVKDLEADAGDEVHVKCDAHPWMSAWIAVTDNANATVTGADGSFKLENVPAGTYKLQVWHPYLGKKEVDVTVKAGEDVEVKVPAFTAADYKEPT